MKLSLFFLLLAIAASSLAQDQAASPSPVPVPVPQPEEGQGAGQDDIVIVTGSTAPPGSPTPAPSPPPSEASSPSPSPEPSSPSPSPEPSSPSPSPEPSPTAAPTSPAPSPTEPPATSPVPVPGPPAFPLNVGNWSVYSGNSPCILVSAALQVHLTEANAAELVIDVPNTLEHVNVSGVCNPERQSLVLHWWSKIDQGERENTLKLEFSKQVADQYALTEVKFTVQEVPSVVNNTRTEQITGQFLLTSLHHSYQCLANQRVQTEETSTMYLLTQNLQVEAFRDTTASGTTPTPNPDPEGNQQFSQAEQCKADHVISTGTMLWLAIGLGLLIIGVIALAIYLVKRCRREGYQRLDAQQS